MKVLILTNYDVGLYQFRKELIQKLLEENEVTISLPYGELVEPLKKMGCKFIDTPIDRRGINPITDFSLLKNYKKILKSEKPDLVITYTIKPNIYGGMLCKKSNIPYAVNITGLGTAFQKDNFLKKMVILLYKTALKKAKVVFFENVENKNIFENLKIISGNQGVLLNGAGVNLEKYQYLEYPEECDTTHFLFMGRVMKEKGIEELFAAVKMLNRSGYKCDLSILGSFEESYSDVIKKYEQEGWLRYYGYKKDVIPYIKKCHCFVLPSWHEGMANTNLECAASGRPVITSNIHGCKEAVVDKITGFLCSPKDSYSLFDALSRFIELSYDDKVEMGLNGRKHMVINFDKKIVVENTVNQL